MPDASKNNSNQSLLELRSYVNWITYTLIPITAIYIYGSVKSNSLSVASFTLGCGISIFVIFFTKISMRSVVNKNIYTFPYGTGKLENFIGFLTGTLMLPISAMIYYSAVNSFMSGKHEVHFESTQIAMIPALLRDIWLLIWSKKLINRTKSPSPILQSFFVDYKVSVTVTIAGILSMLLALWLTRLNYGYWGILIDLALAAVLATYMLVNAIILVKNNFRSLIDLPFAESDQLKIVKVLTSYYHYYSNLGVVYTRTCGNTKIIEIELYFERKTSMEEINHLAENLHKDFETIFDDFSFKLIPVMDPSIEEIP